MLIFIFNLHGAGKIDLNKTFFTTRKFLLKYLDSGPLICTALGTSVMKEFKSSVLRRFQLAFSTLG